MPSQSKANRGPKQNITTCTFRKKKPKHAKSRNVKYKMERNGREGEINISYKVLKELLGFAVNLVFTLYGVGSAILSNAIAFVIKSSKKLFSTTQASVRLQLLLMLELYCRP